MICPNYLICNGNENRFNGVCYTCDNSIIGFCDKEREILGFNRYPSVESQPTNWHENSTRQIETKKTQSDLLSSLYNKRLTTGILTIEEINDNCPICLENKNMFVKHPACNLHRICNSCFKETFFDKEVIYPTEPQCYSTFSNFLNENEIDIEGDIDSNNHREGYNCYCNSPKEDWPLNIKEMYPICSDYDRRYFEIMKTEDENNRENTNLRKCPICRECKLHI
jgi:hypothetical protein